MTNTQVFDTAEHLTSPEIIAAYFNEALSISDDEFIARAIGTVARAQGITEGAMGESW